MVEQCIVSEQCNSVRGDQDSLNKYNQAEAALKPSF